MIEMIELENKILPANWRTSPLGEVIKPIRSRVKPYENPNLPFIGMEHIEAHTMKLLGTVKAGTMKSSAVFFHPGDILYGRLRPYLNKVYRPEFEGLCSAEFIVFPKTKGIKNRYLQYFLNSSEFTSYASHLNTGDRPRVDFDQIGLYPFPIPPFDEQECLVAEIEKQFSRLDEAVAGLKRAKANLKRYKAAILKAAVEGRLTEQWRKEHPDVEPAEKLLQRILAERRAKWEQAELAKMKAKGKKPTDKNWMKRYVEPQPPDPEGLPEIPTSWIWVRLESLTNIKGGITKDSQRKFKNAQTLPYLRVANVQRGYLDLTEVKTIEVPSDQLNDLLLEKGDILFNEGGDRDKLGRGWIWEGQIEKCTFQNHIFRARPYLKEISGKLLSWFGNTYGQKYFIAKGKQTTNLASINKTMLSAFPVPLLSVSEQMEIVGEVERYLTTIAEMEESVEKNLRRSERLRQSILKKAFSGQLLRNDVHSTI